MFGRDACYDELRRLEVPTGRLGGAAAARPWRDRIKPITVTDYKGVLRQIERRHKREEARKDFLTEMGHREVRRKKQFQCLQLIFLLGAVMAVVAIVVAYHPFQVMEVSNILQKFLGI